VAVNLCPRPPVPGVVLGKYEVCHPAEPANNCAVVRHKAPASIILLRPSGPGIRESASIVPNAPRSRSAVRWV
jgi:hypothetical protein